MTNHPNRSAATRLLAQGLEVGRAIYHSGAVTCILGDQRHNGAVLTRLKSALIAVELAMSTYNERDNRQDIPLYREADAFRQNLREGVQFQTDQAEKD